MPIYRRSSSSWTTIRNVYRRTSGSWVQINAVYRRASGSWNRVFSRVSLPSIQSPVTISKSTNGTTFLVTLTGTNYFWSESPTSLSYRFQWSSDGGSSFSDISTGVATNPSSGSSNTYTYSVPTSEVAANVNNLYRFSVTATNSSGGATSTSSNLSYAEIQGPTNISDLSLTSTGSSSASFSWTASTGASAYLLYYTTTPPTYTLGQTVVGSTSGTISGLSGGTFYYFKILPITGTSNTYKGYSGNFSNIVTGSTTALPSPPTITSSSSTTTSITLNFSLGANSTSTRARLNGGFDGSTSGTSYTFSGLSPGTAYTLALYGYNGVVESTTSSGGSFSTQTGAALTPTFGANTSAAGGFTGSVTNYNASYTWGISTNSGSVSFGSPSGSTYPFTVSGLGSGASATVTVTTSRTGYTSGSASTTGTASVTLFAPSAPSPSVTSGPTQTTATVSWSAPANGGSAITSYEAQLGSSGYVNIGNVLSSSISGLTASTSYTYYVRAINAVGTSSAGSVSFTTLAAPVPSVTQIQSTNTNAGPTFMSFAITCANALSCDVRVDRAASSATAPTSSYTAGTSTLLTLSGGSGTVNSTTTASPAGSNAWYRIRVIPYTGASRTGTAGTQVASSWKRNTATSTTTTNPSPTPFGDASV